MIEDSGSEMIAGVGDEVFYFFLLVLLSVVVVVAWYSTAVPAEHQVQSVILVQRADSVSGEAGAEEGGGQGQAQVQGEQVREAVQQFLQQTDHGAEQSQHSQHSDLELESAEVPAEERVTVRLKFLNDTHRDVEASLRESLGQFKRRNFTDELASGKQVRLIFQGAVLREEGSSLESCGLQNNSVIHALVHNTQPNSNSQQSQSGHVNGGEVGGSGVVRGRVGGRPGDLDLSALFLPLLGLALALLWYCCLAYSSAFSLMSSTALIGLTGLYLLSVYGTHFHVNVAVRTQPRRHQ